MTVPERGDRFDWHRKPEGETGPCPVCGCRQWHLGEHREVKPTEGIKAKWMKRVKRPDDSYKITLIGGEGVVTEANRPKVATPDAIIQQPMPGAIYKPHDRTWKRIKTAFRLMAEGTRPCEAADVVGVNVSAFSHWRRRHTGLIAKANESIEADMTGLVEAVRKTAGTRGVLDDPAGYLTAAKAAEKWLEAKGENLFPRPADGHTLVSFFEEYYRPVCLDDAEDCTIQQYRIHLRRWALVAGNPSLQSITVDTLVLFRDFLKASPGLKPGAKMASRSIFGVLRLIQTLLDKAGPPGQRNRDAANIIPSPVPYIRPPRKEPRAIKVISPETLRAVYDAADKMTGPTVDGITPSAWWRTWLVVAFNTGLRFRTLLDLQMKWIDWNIKHITIPASGMKSKRPHVSYLNATTLAHLLEIRTDRELVFPWPHNRREFYTYLDRLQEYANVPKSHRFTPHQLKKTHATAMWLNAPEAARISCAHTGQDTTIQHYVAADTIVGPAVERLPQPWTIEPKEDVT